MARRAALRASDADRDAVAERLRQATVEGRLQAEELEERLEAVFVARTYGELDAVVADLPVRRVQQRPKPRLRHYIVPALVLAMLLPVVFTFVIAVVLFLLTGVFAVWALWLVIGWWIFGHRPWACAPGRRIHWSAPPGRRVQWTRPPSRRAHWTRW